MKIILVMAISINGFIARGDGDENWLPEEGWTEFIELAKGFNNIVMGRETYEQVTARYEDYNFNDVDCVYKIIITHNEKFVAPEGYTVVNSPEEAVDFIEKQGLPELFLIGGGRLNGEFAKRGLIDEIRFSINPYIIGKGRPVFGDIDFELPLELINHTELPNGRVQIRYRVANISASNQT